MLEDESESELLSESDSDSSRSSAPCLRKYASYLARRSAENAVRHGSTAPSDETYDP